MCQTANKEASVLVMDPTRSPRHNTNAWDEHWKRAKILTASEQRWLADNPLLETLTKEVRKWLRSRQTEAHIGLSSHSQWNANIVGGEESFIATAIRKLRT
jgi:hypothetical protein